MKYHIYLDDSGNLHERSTDNFFVYGGLILSEKNHKIIYYNYRNCVEKVKRDKKMHVNEELKAYKMSIGIKRYLLGNVSNNCKQIFVVAKQDLVDRVDLANKKDIVRFKNYAIRFLVQGLFMRNILHDCTELQINLDNQNIAVSAKDSLEDYLHNAFNFDDYYSSTNPSKYCPNPVKIVVDYKSSHNDYLIQAADLLANTKWRKFEKDQCDLYKYLQKDVHCVKVPINNFTSGKSS